MPIYEYTCQECHEHFEARRCMADADMPIACPKCGSPQARRGLSLFATTGCESKGSSSGGGCGSCSGGSCSCCGH